MASSQSNETSEMVLEQRPVMPIDIYIAAIKGDTEYLVQRLGLSEDDHNPIQTKYDNVRAELQSATCSGDSVLHLLASKDRNNEISQKIFRKEAALLKARNNKLETPLHIAAKAGNNGVISNLIQIDSGMVKDALRETDNNGDTTLHTAAKYGHGSVSCALMNLDPQVAYQINKEGLSPLYIAIVEGYTDTVKTMLSVDPNLVCTYFSDGMFPIHVAARMGNIDLVGYFFQIYPDYVELQDKDGRNLFHIAASENKNMIFKEIFKTADNKASVQNLTDPDVVVVGNEMQEQSILSTPIENGWRSDKILVSMINEKDYQGNTPLHIASMKGARKTMKTIWQRLSAEEAAERNNQGLSPFEHSMMYELENNKNEGVGAEIKTYVKFRGSVFSESWFDIVEPWEFKISDIIQLIGLGSVLITTVAFAAAFTFPGGYNADEGTPLLGRRYMFKTFILANTLAFIQSFASIFSLFFNTIVYEADAKYDYSAVLFLSASCCMVLAFGSGTYVMLAPINKNMAIIIFVLALLFGTPTVYMINEVMGGLFKWIDNRQSKHGSDVIFHIMQLFVFPLLFIFCLPFLT